MSHTVTRVGGHVTRLGSTTVQVTPSTRYNIAPMSQHVPTVTQAVQRYLRARIGRGELAPSTVYAQRSTLQRYAQAVGPDRPVTAAMRRSQRWWDSLQCSPSSARAQLATVRTFLRWCVQQRWLPRHPLDHVRAPREPRRLPVTMDVLAVGQLLEALPDVRAYAMAVLMVQCGLRCSEVSRLCMEHLDQRQRTMLVHGKGGHQRVLPLPDQAWQALHAYLDAHPAPGHGPLFRSYLDHTKPVSAGHISNLFTAWMQQAGVKRRPHDGVSAHALRRTCASDMLDQGASVRTVQLALGHAHLNTTEVYLRGLDGEQLRPSMEGRTYSAA